MLNSNLIKNIFSLLAVVLIVFLSFRYVTRPIEDTGVTPGIEVTSADSTESSGETENLANVFAALLEKLATVDFQKGNPIFDNPIFQNGLISFSRQLPEIEKTRANPFAPIEGNPSLYIRYRVEPPVTFGTSSNAFPGAATGTGATSTRR